MTATYVHVWLLQEDFSPRAYQSLLIEIGKFSKDSLREQPYALPRLYLLSHQFLMSLLSCR